jgi:hypothetical protein
MHAFKSSFHDGSAMGDCYRDVTAAAGPVSGAEDTGAGVTLDHFAEDLTACAWSPGPSPPPTDDYSTAPVPYERGGAGFGGLPAVPLPVTPAGGMPEATGAAESSIATDAYASCTLVGDHLERSVTEPNGPPGPVPPLSHGPPLQRSYDASDAPHAHAEDSYGPRSDGRASIQDVLLPLVAPPGPAAAHTPLERLGWSPTEPCATACAPGDDVVGAEWVAGHGNGTTYALPSADCVYKDNASP